MDSSAFRTGVATPLSALRRGHHGIGEYPDLVPFGQWAAGLGFDLLQILPVQDTGDDPSPYAGVSAVALHPIYLCIEEIAPDPTFLEDYLAEQLKLAKTARVDYDAVLAAKTRVLASIFESLDPRALEAQLEAFATEQNWVHVYAAYKILLEENEGRPWSEWVHYRRPRPQDLEDLLQSRHRKWLYHTWVQYHAHRQLLASAQRLKELGVALKGDVPILLQEESADVWFYRDLFDLEGRAGAPPDIYCEEGQYWGFPCYRWERMREDGYAWWRRRIRHASQYYRALRIDHVLGFFRIWRIDLPHTSGRDGHYVPTLPLDPRRFAARGIRSEELDALAAPEGPLLRLPATPTQWGLRFEWEQKPLFLDLDPSRREILRELFLQNESERERRWGELGRERLGALRHETEMLLCAEDLGAVPSCVPEVLDDLGIPGLRVERWCRAENEADRPFWDPAHFPELSVCAPGLHDASSIRGWWEEEDHATRTLYYTRAIHGHREVPDRLDGETVEMILRRNLRTSSMLCVLLLPDCFAIDETLRPLDPADERINVPGTPSHENWGWRMPICIEELDQPKSWNDRLRAILALRMPAP